jgi:hypothetical protein
MQSVIILNDIMLSVVALFYSREAGLLNKSSCLARAFSVTKFINIRDMIGLHFVVLT